MSVFSIYQQEFSRLCSLLASFILTVNFSLKAKQNNFLLKLSWRKFEVNLFCCALGQRTALYSYSSQLDPISKFLETREQLSWNLWAYRAWQLAEKMPPNRSSPECNHSGFCRELHEVVSKCVNLETTSWSFSTAFLGGRKLPRRPSPHIGALVQCVTKAMKIDEKRWWIFCVLALPDSRKFRASTA